MTSNDEILRSRERRRNRSAEAYPVLYAPRAGVDRLLNFCTIARFFHASAGKQLRFGHTKFLRLLRYGGRRVAGCGAAELQLAIKASEIFGSADNST